MTNCVSLPPGSFLGAHEPILICAWVVCGPRSSGTTVPESSEHVSFPTVEGCPPSRERLKIKRRQKDDFPCSARGGSPTAPQMISHHRPWGASSPMPGGRPEEAEDYPPSQPLRITDKSLVYLPLPPHQQSRWHKKSSQRPVKLHVTVSPAPFSAGQWRGC